MAKKLKFGLSQVNESAPLWLQRMLGVLLIFGAAKVYLIGGIPGIDDTTKDLAYGWFDYAMNAAQVAAAVVMIFTGEEKSKPDTDTPLK